MGDSQVIAFTLAAAALTIAPGADTMLVIRNVLRGGRRDGVVTTLGICSGLFVHATLSALGASMLLMHSATAFHLVKLAGACYLGWLGLQSLRRAVRTPPPQDSLEEVEPTRRRAPAPGQVKQAVGCRGQPAGGGGRMWRSTSVALHAPSHQREAGLNNAGLGGRICA